ncbi:MAG: hypothetical protein MRZ79_22810 [Bacteroidia bacterium]|nr:hypothetical protein [Bacteroidia bacterium]
MEIDKLKVRYANRFLQVIIFHENGLFHSSCNSLVDTRLWDGSNLYEKFPILSSLKDPVRLLDQAAMPISLPAVDMDMEGFTGIFDLDIFAHPDIDEYRVWMIRDNTDLYKYLQEIQQERNVLRMEIEDIRNGKSIQRR